MLKFPDFYRRFGVRKEEALKSFSYPKTKDFHLPRESVYHSLPLSESDRGIDPNDLLVANHTGAMYAVHLFELAAHEGSPVRITSLNPTVIIRDLEKQNRQFRRVRQPEVVYNNPTALLIYNYSLLQNLYRYRPNFLNPWQKWYNVYSTLWQNVNQLTKESSRHHFIRFDIPAEIPPISLLQKAEGNLTRALLEVFNNPQVLQLLDLWKWAGGQPSAMDVVDRSAAEKINLVFVEGDRVGVVNLFSLWQWRGLGQAEADEQAVEDEQFIRELEAKTKLRGAEAAEEQTPGRHSAAKLFQRKVLMFFVRLAKLRELVTTGDTTLEDPLTTVLNDQRDEATGDTPVDLFGADELPDEFDQAPEQPEVDLGRLGTQAPGQPEVPAPTTTVPKDDPTLAFVPTDDDLLNDSLFIVKAPEPVKVETTTEETHDVDVLKAPEVGVEARALDLFERGLISMAELKRFQKLAVRYKEIPNPFNEGEETLEQLSTITPELLKFDPVGTSIEPMVGVDDPSLFKSTLLEFRSKYVRDVLQRDIANAVLSAQRAGVAVTDYRVDRVIDAVNKYDEYSVRLVPVGGEPVTVKFTIPTIEEDGSWVADGARYMLRNQRGDAPIRKVSPRRVALSAYRNKLFIERSAKVTNDFDQWLQNQVIASNQSDQPTVKAISYRSGKFVVKSDKWPRTYTGLASRFVTLETETWSLSFEPERIDELYGAERAQWLSAQGLLPFGLSGDSVLAMDESGAIYLVEGKRIETFGDIGTLLKVDLSRAPLEVVEFKVAGKSIPVGITLCYLLGLDRVLKDCGSEPRRVRKGMRLNVGPDEFAVRFFDEALVFSKLDRKAALLFGGFRQFQQQVANYTLSEFNKPDVYLNVIEGRGLGMRQLNALTDLKLYFIDPITLDLLKELGEPETFTGLLYRATELLTHDAIPKARDRIRGYERISAAVYRELTSAICAWRRRPVTSRATIELNPNAVWMAIQTDPANGLVEDSNPINYLKELEAVTFGGTGGRSSRSMVRSTRQYDPDDFGIISEATKDSSDVAISTYMTPNPRLTGLRGVFDTADPENFEMSSVLSTSALCAPFALNDDPKRVNFINIQNSSTVSSLHNKSMPVRTGYESVVAHRVGKLYAWSSPKAGKVLEVSKRHLLVEYEDGTRETCELGRRFGVAAGSTIPHEILTDLKVGDTFGRSEILAWNDGFYQRDRFNPRQVLAKVGVLAKIAIIDSSGTHEDSSEISVKLASQLATPKTHPRTVTLRADQQIRNLVKVGDNVTPDTILCVVEDPLTANIGLFDAMSDDTLRMLSANTPKAEYEGVVERIEVYYRGDKEDMSESLMEVADYYDNERRKTVKALKAEASVTGEVFDRVRIDGNVLEYGNVAIRIFITHHLGMVAGDKVVFGNQMKSVVGRVFTGNHTTESGIAYDGFFSNSSFFNRICNSPYKWGTTNTLVLHGAKRTAQIYRGG